MVGRDHLRLFFFTPPLQPPSLGPVFLPPDMRPCPCCQAAGIKTAPWEKGQAADFSTHIPNPFLKKKKENQGIC